MSLKHKEMLKTRWII